MLYAFQRTPPPTQIFFPLVYIVLFGSFSTAFFRKSIHLERFDSKVSLVIKIRLIWLYLISIKFQFELTIQVPSLHSHPFSVSHYWYYGCLAGLMLHYLFPIQRRNFQCISLLTVKTVDANLANVGTTKSKVIDSGWVDRNIRCVPWFSFMINLCCMFVGKICKIILF